MKTALWMNVHPTFFGKVDTITLDDNDVHLRLGEVLNTKSLYNWIKFNEPGLKPGTPE